MYYLLVFFLFLIFSAVGTGSIIVSRIFLKNRNKFKHTSINLLPPTNNLIAHRGCPQYCPENTLEGFEFAYMNGHSWLEMDVQITNDNKLVIFHDDTLERTTDGQGLLFEKKLSDLVHLNAGHRHGNGNGNNNGNNNGNGQLSGVTYKIPTLGAVLEKFKTRKVVLNLELKVPEVLVAGSEKSIQYKKRLVDKFCKKIIKYKGQEFQIIVSSFDVNMLFSVYEKLSSEHKKYITFSALCEDYKQIETYQKSNIFKYCGIDRDLVTKDMVEKFNNNGISVLVFTVNDKYDIEEFRKMGVYGIFTDGVLPNSVSPKSVSPKSVSPNNTDLSHKNDL